MDPIPLVIMAQVEAVLLYYRSPCDHHQEFRNTNSGPGAGWWVLCFS